MVSDLQMNGSDWWPRQLVMSVFCSEGGREDFPFVRTEDMDNIAIGRLDDLVHSAAVSGDASIR